MVNEQADVVVVGGGVVGLSAALAMRQRGYSVSVLDAGSRNQPPNHRVYALNQASQTLLHALNVWTHMDATVHAPYRHMHIWDAANGAHLDFNARERGVPELGSIVREDRLKAALLLQCEQVGVTLTFETQAHTITPAPDHIRITSHSHTWDAQLLIIADGANSPTRTHLNVPVTTWPYHQHALVASVETSKPHAQTAYQVFHPDGPLAFLPLANPHHCSIVWSTTPTKIATLMALTDEGFQDALNRAFKEKLGKNTLISPRYTFPLHMRHTTQYQGPRWILMGDAAHTIHPLAGLGLNVGLADLAAWLTLMDAQKQSLYAPRLLNAYQRHRKHAVWQTIALMEGIKLLFANPLPPVTLLRGLGLSALNQLKPLKRLLMDHAAG